MSDRPAVASALCAAQLQRRRRSQRHFHSCLLWKSKRQTATEGERLVGPAVCVGTASDGQTAARGPDAARLEVLSGPRQILK